MNPAIMRQGRLSTVLRSGNDIRLCDAVTSASKVVSTTRTSLDAATAALSTADHDLTSGRWRSNCRRSRSVMPPHTPHSMRLSKASARHCARTGHPMQMVFALFWSLPSGNRASFIPLHLANSGQSSGSGTAVNTRSFLGRVIDKPTPEEMPSETGHFAAAGELCRDAAATVRTGWATRGQPISGRFPCWWEWQVSDDAGLVG